MKLVKSRTYKLFYGSCNINGDLKLNKLADIFSELADEQVDELKSVYPFLNNHQNRWILVRYHIQIGRMIHAEEVFSVNTYQSYYSKYSCLRDYIVEDESGKRIISAVCQWVMKNMETRRIIAVPKEYCTLTAEKCGEKRPELPKIEEFTCTETFKLKPRYDDYDYNGHVNNAKYFSFLEDGQSYIDRTKYRIAEIDINYKTGMIYGKDYMICSQTNETDNGMILNQKIFDSDTAALMRSKWVSI